MKTVTESTGKHMLVNSRAITERITEGANRNLG